jgi:hypothetical protein
MACAVPCTCGAGYIFPARFLLQNVHRMGMQPPFR